MKQIISKYAGELNIESGKGGDGCSEKYGQRGKLSVPVLLTFFLLLGIRGAGSFKLSPTCVRWRTRYSGDGRSRKLERRTAAARNSRSKIF